MRRGNEGWSAPAVSAHPPPGPGGPGAGVPDPRRGGRQPQPVRRQRRAARRSARRSTRRRPRSTSIAVGYSLGPGRLGALPRRPRRPLRPQADARCSASRCPSPPACWPPTRRSDEVLVVARVLGGVSRRHGLPDHPGADHGPVVRAGAHPGRSPCGRPSVAPSPRSGPLDRRLRCSRSSGGARSSSSPCRSRWSRSSMALAVRAGPRQRDDRAGRQPRRHPLRRARRRARPGHQLRAGAGRGHARRSGWPSSPSRPASPSSSASAGRRTRSTTSHVAGRRIFWVAAVRRASSSSAR